MFDLQVAALFLPSPQAEYRFDAERRWRFDRAWVVSKIAVEIEGGTWVKGRHSRGAGMRADAEKYNEATLQGWRVFRFTGDMVKDGSAIRTVERALTPVTYITNDDVFTLDASGRRISEAPKVDYVPKPKGHRILE